MQRADADAASGGTQHAPQPMDNAGLVPAPATAANRFGLVTGAGAVLAVLTALNIYRPKVAVMGTAGERASATPGEVEFDGEAVLRYLGATGLQWTLLMATLWVLDQTNAYLVAGLGLPVLVPQVLVVLFFAFTSLKSRVFSPLDNSRPTVNKEQKEIDEKKRPSWMPPPLVFPIVWTSIAVLRTISGYMIWNGLGQTLLVTPIMVYFLGLSIGDTFNTINNVEKRMGTAFIAVLFVWSTFLAVNYIYYQALPTAGLVLLPQSIWLSIATCLIYSIWRLNGAEPLYPYKPKA